MQYVKMATLGLFLAMVGAPAFGADWIYVTAENDGSPRFYDADTIERSGTQVTFWERRGWRQGASQESNECCAVLAKFKYDCHSRTSTLLVGRLYYRDGSVALASKAERTPNAEPIFPDSPEEKMFRVVCHE